MKWLKRAWNFSKKALKFVVNVWKDVSSSLRSPKSIFIITIGVLLVLVGQIGIIIPIFPGLALTIPGLIILSLYSPTVYRVLKSKLTGHPKIESSADKTRNWLIRIIRTKQ